MKRAQHRKHTWLEKFAVTFAALAFLAAGYQGWVARDTEKRSLRAYVGGTGEIKFKEETLFSPTQISLSIQNYGETPATDVKIFGNWYDTAPGKELPDDFAFSETHECPEGEGVAVLYPKTPIPAQMPSCEKAVADRAKRVFMSGTLYLYGHIEYRDVFSERHVSTFCLSWTSGVSGYCARHNEIDPPAERQ